jgi:hypothetical protein
VDVNQTSAQGSRAWPLIAGIVGALIGLLILYAFDPDAECIRLRNISGTLPPGPSGSQGDIDRQLLNCQTQMPRVIGALLLTGGCGIIGAIASELFGKITMKQTWAGAVAAWIVVGTYKLVYENLGFIDPSSYFIIIGFSIAAGAAAAKIIGSPLVNLR